MNEDSLKRISMKHQEKNNKTIMIMINSHKYLARVEVRVLIDKEIIELNLDSFIEIIDN